MLREMGSNLKVNSELGTSLYLLYLLFNLTTKMKKKQTTRWDKFCLVSQNICTIKS